MRIGTRIGPVGVGFSTRRRRRRKGTGPLGTVVFLLMVGYLIYWNH
ncbi:hypothetical protein EV284_3506 [Streptomyces sp. BK022]|nr:hypothetical protein EV284_3506 [Streptomyces sp. BK022]